MSSPFKKDLQYYKFCLYGFLKNQKFYEPFFLLFLLSKDITYLQAGILYSIKELAINLLEIPAGIVADSGGRRRSMLISFSLYIVSFILFFLAQSYFLLIIAMIVFAMGDVFRTGTHKAMIFDYLERMGWGDHRVAYYGNTRSWSQKGSAVSALIAATIVIVFKDYPAVFAFAIIPYLLNFINLISYPKYLDGESQKIALKDFRSKISESFNALLKNLKQLSRIRIYLNSSLISGTFNASKDYIQPLIISLTLIIGSFPGLDTESSSSLFLGIIYSLIFIINSVASRLSGKAAKISGSEFKGMNYTYLAFVLALAGTSICYHLDFLYPAIILFVLLFAIENLRRPVAIATISYTSSKENLATWLSVDSLLKSLITMIISPLIGLVADRITPGLGLGAPAIILIALYLFIALKERN
jgi:MFS family permease